SSFYQDVVLKALAQMSKGTLHLTLPDGGNFTMGTGEGNISARINIVDNEFYTRVIMYGDIGFGEAYVDGLWDTDNITNVIKWVLLNIDNAPGVSGSNSNTFILNILKIVNRLTHIKRANSLNGSKKNIAEHYDLNNDFFALFLDPTMTYSSAY